MRGRPRASGSHREGLQRWSLSSERPGDRRLPPGRVSLAKKLEQASHPSCPPPPTQRECARPPSSVPKGLFSGETRLCFVLSFVPLRDAFVVLSATGSSPGPWAGWQLEQCKRGKNQQFLCSGKKPPALLRC